VATQCYRQKNFVTIVTRLGGASPVGLDGRGLSGILLRPRGHHPGALAGARHGNDSLRHFIYYIERHIELDGDTHGPMGRELLEGLVAEAQSTFDLICVGLQQSLVPEQRPKRQGNLAMTIAVPP
jgi:hypothetical protein